MRWLLYGIGLLCLIGCGFLKGEEGCQYGLKVQELCHEGVYRNCLRVHREAGRIKLDENYNIIEAGKNKVHLADCIIKKYNCRDDYYYDVCHPEIPPEKQSRFSDLGWTPETFFDPEVEEPPGLTKQREEDRKKFWGVK